MNVRIVCTLPEEEWHRFVEENPQGNIFHTPEMFQVFARARGHTPSLWAAVDGTNRILALLTPTLITLAGGPLRRFTTRAVSYGSVLCAPDSDGPKALEILLRAYQHNSQPTCLFTELRNLSDQSVLQPVLQACDFTYEDHLNFLVDISGSPETIWKNIRSSAQRNIRKAQKSVIVQTIEDSSRIPAIYALLKQVYQRIRVPLADPSFFQSAFDLLYPRGMFTILVARVQDVDIGALMLLLYKDTIYYWYTGVLKEYASYRASDLLVWHALEWGNQNGFRVLDFGGGGKPNEEYGVRNFKAKFGGELVNFGRNIYVHNPLLFNISRQAYTWTRLFWSVGLAEQKIIDK